MPISSTLLAIFAKSSVVWSSLLYMFTNKSIRSKLNFGLFFKKRIVKKRLLIKANLIDEFFLYLNKFYFIKFNFKNLENKNRRNVN